MASAKPLDEGSIPVLPTIICWRNADHSDLWSDDSFKIEKSDAALKLISRLWRND
jgi:hypothetical protein